MREGWERYKLSELCLIYAGGSAPQSKTDFSENGAPFIRAGSLPKLLSGISEDLLEKITPNVAKQYKLKLFQEGTILFAKSGMSATMGHIYILKKPSYVVNHLAAIVPKNQTDISFLYHYLKKYSLTSLIRDPSYPSIRLEDISEINIVAPQDDLQRIRIAAILDKAVGLIEAQKNALKTLDALKSALFIETFGNPVTNPMDWEVKLLGEICSKITDGTHQSPKWEEHGIPFLFCSNIRNGEIDFNTKKYISQKTHDELTRNTKIEKNDVLYTAVGSYGFSAVVNGEIAFNFQRHIAHIKPKAKNVNSIFLAISLESEGLRRQADKVAKGVAQKTVTLADMKNFQIPLPPLSLQTAFAAKITHLNALKTTHQARFAQLTALFSALQHKAFAGEL